MKSGHSKRSEEEFKNENYPRAFEQDEKENLEWPLSVPRQVDRLIEEATKIQNLCQSYVGWCPFW